MYRLKCTNRNAWTSTVSLWDDCKSDRLLWLLTLSVFLQELRLSRWRLRVWLRWQEVFWCQALIDYYKSTVPDTRKTHQIKSGIRYNGPNASLCTGASIVLFRLIPIKFMHEVSFSPVPDCIEVDCWICGTRNSVTIH